MHIRSRSRSRTIYFSNISHTIQIPRVNTDTKSRHGISAIKAEIIEVYVCIYMYVHTCRRTYVNYTCMNVCAYVFFVAYIYIYIYIYIHTYIHTYTYVQICMHTNIHTYIRTYIHTYIHTCMHAFIHTCIHKRVKSIMLQHGWKICVPAEFFFKQQNMSQLYNTVMKECTHKYLCVCMYACMFVCMYDLYNLYDV